MERRLYELMVIVHPEKESASAVEGVEEEIKALKGKVEKKEEWGKRKLSYPIRHQEEGVYVLFHLNFPPENVGELRKKLGIREEILRSMVAKTERG